MYPPAFPMMPLQQTLQTKTAVTCTAASVGCPPDFTWSNTTAAIQPADNNMMIMQQSEYNGVPPPPYPYPWSLPQNQQAMVPTYEEGSLLSPGSSDSSVAGIDELPYNHSSMTAPPFCSNYYTQANSTVCEPVTNNFNQTSASSPGLETNECVQKEIKMPQSKRI